jgi:hypothetical protein
MQNEIDPESSSIFSREYYKCLLTGCDVGEAVTKGRFVLGTEYNVASEKDMYGNNEFGSPVLFINTIEPVTPLPAVMQYVQTEGSSTGRRNCSFCGADNDMDSRFCRSCGRPLIAKSDRDANVDDQRSHSERAFAANSNVGGEAEMNAARVAAVVRSSSGAANKK